MQARLCEGQGIWYCCGVVACGLQGFLSLAALCVQAVLKDYADMAAQAQDYGDAEARQMAEQALPRLRSFALGCESTYGPGAAGPVASRNVGNSCRHCVGRTSISRRWLPRGWRPADSSSACAGVSDRPLCAA